MPIESYVDSERRCVVAKVTGDFSLADIVREIDRSVKHPDFRPGFGVLSDHTEVGEPLTRAQAIDMVAHLESLAASLAGARWAVVASKPASHGMLRMVSVFAEGVPMEVQVFPSLASAEAWLSSERESDG